MNISLASNASQEVPTHTISTSTLEIITEAVSELRTEIGTVPLPVHRVALQARSGRVEITLADLRAALAITGPTWWDAMERDLPEAQAWCSVNTFIGEALHERFGR